MCLGRHVDLRAFLVGSFVVSTFMFHRNGAVLLLPLGCLMVLLYDFQRNDGSKFLVLLNLHFTFGLFG